MRGGRRSDSFAVFDDVLSPEEHAEIWQWAQAEPLVEIHSTEWRKVWRPNDGAPLAGPNHVMSAGAQSPAVAKLFSMFQSAAARCSEVVDSWQDIAFRVYLYRRGTKLSWHNDAGRAGALIYYAHRAWSASWGGELLIAETSGSLGVHPFLPSPEEDAFLLENGAGVYIQPKPNRLVVTRPSVWHSLARIDDDAGHNVRASVCAFLLRERQY